MRAPPKWDRLVRARGRATGIDASRGLHVNVADHALDAAVAGAGVSLSFKLIASDDMHAGRLVTARSARNCRSGSATTSSARKGTRRSRRCAPSATGCSPRWRRRRRSGRLCRRGNGFGGRARPFTLAFAARRGPQSPRGRGVRCREFPSMWSTSRAASWRAACASSCSRSRTIAPRLIAAGQHLEYRRAGRSGARTGRFEPGFYDARFHIADYYRAAGGATPAVPFLDVISYRFGIAEPEAHYHLPMKCTPWGYSCFAAAPEPFRARILHGMPGPQAFPGMTGCQGGDDENENSSRRPSRLTAALWAALIGRAGLPDQAGPHRGDVSAGRLERRDGARALRSAAEERSGSRSWSTTSRAPAARLRRREIVPRRRPTATTS